MKKQFFQKKVDMRSRQKMIDFLQNHFRYNTMNSWNASTSYAHCVKIHRLGLTKKQEDTAYALIECENFYEYLHNIIQEFNEAYDWHYQICFNGRSSGYLVLIKGGWKYSDYKSYCTECYQRNFQVATKANKRCGVCGKDTRKNFETLLKEYFTYPGKNIDMNEDFEEWSAEELKHRVRLIKTFDKTIDAIRQEVICLTRHGKIKNFTSYHEETRKRIVSKECH